MAKNELITVFEGRIVQVHTQTIKLPNGHPLDLEIVEHPGGAAVVAVNHKQEICLLRQYRAVFEDWFLELPAGKRDNAEPPLDTARRELQEEAGVVAAEWTQLGDMASSPGVFTERVYLYMARNLSLGDATLGDDEVVSETLWVPLTQACEWAYEGRISDAKSVIAILRADHVLQEKST